MKHEASYAASCYFCLFHSGSPYFVSGCRFVSFKIAASGARALLAMTNLIGFAGKRNGFSFCGKTEQFQVLRENGTILGFAVKRSNFRFCGKTKQFPA